MLYFVAYFEAKSILDEDEKESLEVLQTEVRSWIKSGLIGKRTIRGLKQQIREALVAYVKRLISSVSSSRMYFHTSTLNLRKWRQGGTRCYL